MLLIGLWSIVGWPMGCGAVAQEGTDTPAMCAGRRDTDRQVTARMDADPSDPATASFALAIASDAEGEPTGELLFEDDRIRLRVVDLCRVWGNRPGGGSVDRPEASGGECPEEGAGDGATIVHVVGVSADGTDMLVRADIRETAAGSFFRVRWRPLSAESGASEGSGSDHGEDGEGSWERYPAEGWARLDALEVAVGPKG